MKNLEKKYNFKEVEKKWQKYWQDNNIYGFNWENNNNIFSIDTPPPTVSGTLHMGHIFSYSQSDFIARFQRMSGKNVFYPIGFDDNGLPTERYVEKLKDVKGKNMPRNEFITLCKENVPIAEDQFENLFKSVSFSFDWKAKYQTISDSSRRISQMSFLDLYDKGVLYQKSEPCIWDVVDQTALAQTELEDKDIDSQMNYLKFDIKDGGTIDIMTTRPELLPACVAIICHPDNFEKYKNKTIITPLGVEVPIFADDKVDKEKGTGFVMCCTFGDQTDIDWWKKFNLDLRIILNEAGRLDLTVVKNLINKKYLVLDGLKIKEAREQILELLREDNKIFKDPEKITHAVKIGERSKNPIEFLVTKQWFVKVLDVKEELHKKASEINWHPQWMESRIHNWIDGLSWDWCISRQRFSGIPIPVWYSKRKGEEGKVILPKKEQLPIDPMIDLPDGYTRDEVEAETDVLDTWATSSVSPNLSSQGINSNYVVDEKKFNTLKLPFDLRSQAHEIIRTWAFCTIVKAHYHQNVIPWKNIMISGWCLASDKTKMSKSLGNVVSPIGLIEEKGSDAVRYWAANSSLGMDTAYSDEMIGIGQKLVLKLFNAAKFAEMHFKNCSNFSQNNIKEKIDLCLMYKIKQVLNQYNKHFENYDYNKALEVVENFFWNDFCDNYLEIVKVRCYGINGIKYKDLTLTEEEKNKINSGQISAINTIYYVFNYLLKMFAPFVPCVCEEIYSCLYEEEFIEKKSINGCGNCAKIDFVVDNYDILWSLLLKIIADVRKYKSEKNISIKEIVETLEVVTKENIDDCVDDLKNVCNVNNISVENGDYKINIL